MIKNIDDALKYIMNLRNMKTIPSSKHFELMKFTSKIKFSHFAFEHYF